MKRNRLRAMALGCAFWPLVSCDRTTEVAPQATFLETWNSDLTTTGQVLFISIRRVGTEVSGSGNLRPLLTPGGGDSLVIVGHYQSDTLELILNAVAGYQMQFTGTYGPRFTSLQGTLDGGAFSNKSVSFRSQ